MDQQRKTTDGALLRRSIYITLSFTALLWFIKAVEWAAMIDLTFLGIYPRSLTGAIGIITSPLVHGDEFHLLSNTFPLITLGLGLFYFYSKIAKKVFLWIYFLTGIWVWIIAREAYHIGASGIVYGILSFLFFIGLFQKDSKSIAISLIILFLYQGMWAGIAPVDESISYESHILGSIAGVFVAFFYRKENLLSEEELKIDPEFDEEVHKPEEDEFQTKNETEAPVFNAASHTYNSKNGAFQYRYSLTNSDEKKQEPNKKNP